MAESTGNVNNDDISASQQANIPPALIATRDSMSWLFKSKILRFILAVALALLICAAIYSLYIFTRHADPAEIFIFSAARHSPDKPFTVLVLARNAKTEQPLRNQSIDLYMELNGKEFRKLPAAKTGDDGIAPVAVNPCPAGEYQIKATLRDLSAVSNIQVKSVYKSMLSSDQSIIVKPYSPAECKVILDTNKTFYLPGDIVAGTVSIRDLHGKPLAAVNVSLDAAVTVKVTERHNAGRRRAYSSITARQRQLTAAGGVTDVAGKLKFEFMIPKELAGIDFRQEDTDCKISATAVSPAGRQHSLSRMLTVTARPIRITCMPESGQLLPGIPNKMYIFVSNPCGAPLETAMKAGDQAFHTGKDGLALISLPPERKATVINVTDNAGHKIEKNINHGYNTDLDAFILKTEKTVVRAGEELQLDIIANQAGGRIFIYLVKDETPLKFMPVTLDARQKQLKIKIHPDISGIVQIHAYRILPNGKAMHELRLVQIMPEKQPAVKINSSQPNQEQAYFLAQDDCQPLAAATLLHEPVNQLAAGYLLANLRCFSTIQAQNSQKYADRENLLIKQKIKFGNKLFLYLLPAALILLAVFSIPFLLAALNTKNNSYRMVVSKEYSGEITRLLRKLQWMFGLIIAGVTFFIVSHWQFPPAHLKYELILTLSILFILLLWLAESVKTRNRIFRYCLPDSGSNLQKIILLIPWIYGIFIFAFLILVLATVFFPNTPGLCFMVCIYFILSLIPLFGLSGIQCSIYAQEYLDLYCSRDSGNMGSGIGCYSRSFSSLWIAGSGLYTGPIIITYLIIATVIISLFLPLTRILDCLGK